MNTHPHIASESMASADSPIVQDTLAGLSKRPRSLPTQYLYDARGSELFEQITRLPEYYLTRTELSIFDTYLDEMSSAIGPSAWLIELGSGMGTKTLRLLEAMQDPAGYTPIEISPAALDASLQAFQESHPGLTVQPLYGDFNHDLTLPDTADHRRVVFFPGSTLGNFEDESARALLKRMALWVGPGGGLLIGVDLIKPPEMLIPAYDDSAGVTAEFNLNLLDRLNREAQADFKRKYWKHHAAWNADASRMESYLVSLCSQHVRVADRAFEFDANEPIWIEQSQKYTVASLMQLAEDFTLRSTWTDAAGWFAVLFLEVPDA